MPGPGFRKEPDEVGRFLAPPASYFYRQDDEFAPSGVEQFWVCSLLALSSWVQCRPSKGACMSAGLPFSGDGGNQSCVDGQLCSAHRWRPLAMTSIRRSSWRCKCWRLRSATLVLVVTRAPASRQIVAAARSRGTPRLRNIPACGHAARWSPRGSRARRHRHWRADKGRGSRRRRRRSKQNKWDG